MYLPEKANFIPLYKSEDLFQSNGMEEGSPSFQLTQILKPQFFIGILAILGLLSIGIGLYQAGEGKENEEEIVIEKQEKSEIPSDEIVIDISGAVKKPGVYTLHKGDRIADALEIAGGMSEEVNTEAVSRNINLATVLVDGIKIYIPFEGEEGSVLGSSGSQDTPGGVSLNNSTSSELESLPGIGEVTAEKIISLRPYQSLEDVVSKGALRQSVFEKVKNQLSL